MNPRTQTDLLTKKFIYIAWNKTYIAVKINVVKKRKFVSCFNNLSLNLTKPDIIVYVSI